jgi:hypothetical protein
LTLNYSGPNPQGVLRKYIDLLKLIFKVSDSEIQEKVFNWDRSGKEEKFEIEFELRKDLDNISYVWVQGALSGNIRPSEEFGKEGNIKITIRGAIRAEYPQDTLWQKSIVYEFFRVLYHKILYVGAWEKYMEDCRMMLRLYIDEMKAYLNLLQKTGI